MLHACMPARFENIEEANEVGLHVVLGMGEGVAHAGLCGEMDHALGPVLVEQPINGRLVGEIAFDEGEAVAGLKLRRGAPP